MARALSHLFSLMRGSVGGLTYFSNQYHQICLRQRTAPVQPNTGYQLGIRTAFDAAEAAWSGLSDEDRQLWASYAQTCVYPGPAGDYTVPGRQLMVGTLALALYANGVFPDTIAISSAPPLVAGWYNPGDFIATQYTGVTQGIALAVRTPAGPFSSIVVDSSIGFSATRLRYKGPWVSSRKHFQQLPPNLVHQVSIDLPAGLLGKTVFSHSRVFTTEVIEEDPIPHRLAFPVILRHICEEPETNGNGDDKPPRSSTKKVTKKKVAKTGD